MNTRTSRLVEIVVAGLFAMLMMAVAGFWVSSVHPAGASAPSGLFARVATSSTVVVTPNTTVVLFGTTTKSTTGVALDLQCSSRIISTTGSALYLSFSDISSSTPSAPASLYNALGHVQASSTNVVYDSGLYGCGLVSARSSGTSTVTLTETN